MFYINLVPYFYAKTKHRLKSLDVSMMLMYPAVGAELLLDMKSPVWQNCAGLFTNMQFYAEWRPFWLQ